MSGTDLEELEEIRGLIERGARFGVLTHAEVASLAAELGLEERDVEELHAVLEQREIELVSGTELGGRPVRVELAGKT